jgi:hypothetical protein
MKYVPPYGRESEGDSAQYINGDPSIGRQGSIPPANAFEHPMREIVHTIEKNWIYPSEYDLYQLVKATRSQRVNYAEDTGSANNISVAFDPPLGAYTVGLVLRVRMKVTNTGATRINAGTGIAAVRKMSGADVAAGDLPAGAIATLVYDGTNFQLTNFGGAGGGTGTPLPPEVFEVKIPYCVDTSTTPGIITANFSPAITALSAGDEIAVKVANTSPGPTIIYVNGLPPIHLQPNGGGMMLQGDIHAGNIVVFFYDGTYLYFQPDPQIDAFVVYMVGPGQTFPDIQTGMNTIKRKTIGADGYVVFQFVRGVFNGNIYLSHPSADRICIAGTMIGPNPTLTDFIVSGADAPHRASDANYNLAFLRSRYGTEIQIPAGSPGSPQVGVSNNGPGTPRIQDLLITDIHRPPPPPPGVAVSSIGVYSGSENIFLLNVGIWGPVMGIWSSSKVSAQHLFVCACTDWGIYVVGGNFDGWDVGVFGNDYIGVSVGYGTAGLSQSKISGNGSWGVRPSDSSSVYLPFSTVIGNTQYDILAWTGSTALATGTTFGNCSPPVNTVGNLNAIVCSVPPPSGPG